MTEVRKSGFLKAIPLLIAVCLISIPSQAQYGGGSGEPNGPYLIYTAEQMNAIGANQDDWDKHFKLMSDIDLSGYKGTDFNIIGYVKAGGMGRGSQVGESKKFTGVFDGNGYTVSNFSYISTDSGDRGLGMPATDTGYIGLFGSVDDPNAEIRDLGLIEPNIFAKKGSSVGLLVGRLSEGTVTGCYVDGGSVSGSKTVGGLVGYNSGTITDCNSSAIVSGTENIGGLVGCDWEGTITKCSSSGSVSGTGGYVGGLVGDNNYDTIRACYSSSNVSGMMNVGGLVGDNEGAVSNCYSVGSVTGANAIGGLVGFHWGGLGSTITNCYSAGSVLGTTDSGGLVGFNYGQRSGVMNSVWDIQTSEQSTSAGGTGKTTEEMQLESTFTDAGWDFAGESTNGTEDIWTFYEGTKYPRLAWAEEPVTKVSYGGGAGTQENPYLIYTAEQLNMIGLLPGDWGRHFKLMADIDLGGFSGTDFNIIGYVRSMPDDNQPFFGVFDGNGKTISNFNYYSETEQFNIGIFGYVDGENALIKNLGLIDPNIDVGTSWKSTTTSSLVAVNGGTITNCYVQGGSVSGSSEIGGLVGHNSYGTIKNCYSATDVSGDSDVGGLVGYLWDGTIINCYSSAGVSGNIQSITGTFFYVCGLVGSNSLGEISASFWDVETSGQIKSAGGIGKTTTEMQTVSTFLEAGWDFIDETENGTEDIWWIDEGQDYPRLWWEPSSERPNDDLFFLLVDDFESYNERILWIDGWGTLTNGSAVSELSNIDPYFNPDLWGFNIPGVHGGEWSMACFYDNTNTMYSEATKILVWPRNWKQDGVGVLSLWLSGDPTNAPEPMYVALANTDGSTAVVYHDNPNVTQIDIWMEWRIDLQEFAEQGVDLTNVNSITIGLGNRDNPVGGGSGLVFFDDIRLYRSAP